MHEFLEQLADEHGRTFPVHAVIRGTEYVVELGHEMCGRRVTGVVFCVDLTWHAYSDDDLVAAGVVPADDFALVLAGTPKPGNEMLPFLGAVA